MASPDPTQSDFYVDGCCWHPDGWESAGEFSVQDATKVSRAEAMARFARVEFLPWVDVGAWKRYIRPFGDQEIYEWWIEYDEWRDDERGGGWDKHPSTRPTDWQEPDPFCESKPYWQFCTSTHPDAHAVWICGNRAAGSPPALRPANG